MSKRRGPRHDGAYHRVCICTWDSEQEPKPDTFGEALRISADQVTHDTPVESRDGDTQHCPQNEEERVRGQNESLFGVPRWKCYPQDGKKLPQEGLVETRFMRRRDEGKVLRVLGECGGGGRNNIDLQKGSIPLAKIC